MTKRYAIITDPRKPGMVTESGYWKKQSLVRAITVRPDGDVQSVTEIDPDGRVRNHCTQWEHGRYGTADTIVTPQFEHDCDACLFLGTNGARDLYVHHTEGARGTVIVRYSDEGSDYASSSEAEPHNPGLAEARLRANAWLADLLAVQA